MFLERIWTRLLQLTAEFVTPDWGKIIGLHPGRHRGHRRGRPALDVPADPDRAAGPSRQAADRAADAGRDPHAGTVVRAGLRGGRRVPAVPRPRLRRLDPAPRRDRAGADAAVLAGRGASASTTTTSASTRRRTLPAVVHDGPPPGVHMPGPSWRPFLGRVRDVRAVPRPRVRWLAADRGRHRPDRDPRRLAGRRGQGVPRGRPRGHDRPPREPAEGQDAVAAVRRAWSP